MIVVGIDPGISGALALVDHHGLRHVADMPVMPRSAGGAFVKNQVAPAALAALLAEWLSDHDKNEVHVLVESVSAMPKQGVASTFSLALTAGLIEGVLAARGYSHELVRPQVWKKAMGLTASKDQARARASRLYPEADIHRVKDHNRAEAILIARYGYDRRA